eukprot:11210433-Lingulodinium_polyedra.AAC.1
MPGEAEDIASKRIRAEVKRRLQLAEDGEWAVLCRELLEPIRLKQERPPVAPQQSTEQSRQLKACAK